MENLRALGLFLRRLGSIHALCMALAAGIFMLAPPSLCAQTAAAVSKSTVATTSATTAPATTAATTCTIESLRIVQEKKGPAVEILATKPLVPTIQTISDPPRLVIDLPNAHVEMPTRINVQADQINALRANQFQINPPVARVVVDLEVPRAYTWETLGNRLVVHLGRNPDRAGNSPFQAPTVTSLTSAPPPVVASIRAAGPLAIAGSTEASGSAITAGPDTAILNLSSGGEVRVCPGTTVSATPSENRHNVMLSMNTGAMEAHFILDESSDSVLTPDFRILLAGPGEFHFAISADRQGNTCVRALAGNTSGATVTELLGDRTYEIKPTDQLVFHAGRLDRVDMTVAVECGCPVPRETPMRANRDLPVQDEAGGKTSSDGKENPETTAENPSEAQTGAGAPADVKDTNEVRVQIAAPFVFRAGPPDAPPANASPADTHSQAATAVDSGPSPSASSSSPTAGSGAVKTGAQKTPNASPRGFFKKIGAFFASLFH